MNTVTEERPVFENEEWLVTELGLEHKDTGYFIDRDCIANRRNDGLWTWPMHMAEKNWCRMQPFAEAFTCAASIYRIHVGDDLTRTFEFAQCETASRSMPKGSGETFHAATPRTLRRQAPAPISRRTIVLKNPLSNKTFSNSDDSGVFRFKAAPRAILNTMSLRASHLDWVKAALSGRTSRRTLRTGAKLIRMLQTSWNIR